MENLLFFAWRETKGNRKQRGQAYTFDIFNASSNFLIFLLSVASLALFNVKPSGDMILNYSLFLRFHGATWREGQFIVHII